MKKRLRKRIEYGGSGDGAGEDVLYVPLLNDALVKVKSKWMSELEARKRSVRLARETDRRLRARTATKLNRILDITYAAIRKRPQIFMLLLLTLFIGGCKGTDYTVNATVADKFYTPPSTGTGVGMPMGKGGPALVVTSNPAVYTLFLRYDDGKTLPQSVSQETWVQFERGESVRVRFNSIWGIEEIEKRDSDAK